MYQSQYGIRKIEVTYVLINPVSVVSSSEVTSTIHPGKTFLLTLMLASNNIGYLIGILVHFSQAGGRTEGKGKEPKKYC